MKGVPRSTWWLWAATAALGLAANACSATPPPRWQEGGATLLVAPAQWQSADGVLLRLETNGEVLQDGEVRWVVDTAGRVATAKRDPVAVLEPDGTLRGTDSEYLGQIGVHNAAPPGSAVAWLSLTPDGTVMLFDDEGERHSYGRWTGCDGPQRRTCTLLTHLALLEWQQRAATRAAAIGIWRW